MQTTAIRSAPCVEPNYPAIEARTAAQEAFWRRTPADRRSHDAGHRCVTVLREGVLQEIPLLDLTDRELTPSPVRSVSAWSIAKLFGAA